MTLIIENPKADDERTTRTPGRPCRLTVSGYVIWSSTSCGERPVQSVKTMTWLSLRSGIASIGVVSSAQYPQAPTSTNRPRTRKRFRSDASISQLTMPPPCEMLVVHRSVCAVLGGSRRKTDACRDQNAPYADRLRAKRSGERVWAADRGVRAERPTSRLA